MRVEPISFGRAYAFRAAAAKERCIISDTADTHWYGITVGERLAGFTAVMLHKGGTWARFKGTYILPSFRGQGLSVELNEYTLKLALQKGVEAIDAYTTPINTKWYIKRGFTVKSEKNGISYVVLMLDEKTKAACHEPLSVVAPEPPAPPSSFAAQSKMFDLPAQNVDDGTIRPEDSGMKSYKGWTKEQRLASLKLTKEAIRNGEIPKPSKCNRCAQTQGIIQYHNEDYSHPTKYLEELCWRCHMVHHSARRAPAQCKAYWESVKAGKVWPPVYRHDFAILARDHGIN